MESLTGLLGPVAIIFLALVVASACVRVLRQYERGVMFTLGRFSGVRGPGSSS
jgi:regulator of protease activity HflC (stomatin/prohibitin superfamily)